MFKRFNKGFVFLILLSMVLFGFPLSSISYEFNNWQSLGIYGGTIYDIAIDPSDPNRVFAGSYLGDGLFLTEDGGDNWQPVEASIGAFREDAFKNHAVYAVKIAPGDPNIVWVAHDFWVEKSMDGGQTWTHISNSEMQLYCTNCGGEDDVLRICRSLVIDPVDPNIVYVGTSGPNGSYSSGAIYKTGDGGASWLKIKFDSSSHFDYMIMDMDIDSQHPNVIWAVTNSEGGETENQGSGTLYRSDNCGGSWEKIFPSEHSKSSSDSTSTYGFFAVAVKPNDSDTVFTGGSSGMRKHYRRSNEWSSDLIEISGDYLVRDITFDPIDPEVIYTAWSGPDSLFIVARSIDGGESWDQNEVEYEFLTLAVHPSTRDIIFGGELNLGVYKSQDHGQTWEPINNGINAMIINDIAIDPNDSNHIITGTHCGVYEKKNNEDWLKRTREKTSVVAFHPKNTQIFYAGVEGKLGKTIDGGNNWIYSESLGEENNYVSSVAIDPNHPDTLFISVSGKGIYKSTGQSPGVGDWFENPVLSNDQYNFNIVMIDPSNSKHIFAGGGDYNDTNAPGVLYESAEAGDVDTWVPFSFTDKIVNTILIDPEDPNMIYIGCETSGDKRITVYKTMDDGKTWESSCKGMHTESLPLYGFNVWGTSSDHLFLVGEEGTIRHYDGRWSSMRSGTKRRLCGIWGTSGSDIFVVGEGGTILRYNGSTWSAMGSGTTRWLGGIWGTSGSDIFVVGEGGIILRYNGSTWSAMDSGTTRWLGGIWGTSDSDIFVVGDGGTTLRYNGSAWSAMDSNTTEGLWSVWEDSSTDVFAVGSNGTILRYNGSAWSAMESNTTENLWGVWGDSPTDVFAVGSNGTILRYNGTIWSAMDSDTSENLMRIWGISSTEVFVVGNKGTILQYDGQAWTRMNVRRMRVLSTDTGDSLLDVSTPIRLRSMDDSHDSSKHTRGFGQTASSPITDLKFHPKDKNVIYAATMSNGIFVSTNQGNSWLNLGIPPYYVYALEFGSVVAGTSGGANQLVGLGLIIGKVIDGFSKEPIHEAIVKVAHDISHTTDINGNYILTPMSGIYDVTTIAMGYIEKTVQDVNAGMPCGLMPPLLDISMEKTIQQRINEANDGDVIEIYPDVYDENIDFDGKSITLKSIDPNDPNIVAETIINGKNEGSVVTFNSGEGPNSAIIGLTIRNGNAPKGGGIYCYSSSPLISNCIITENSAVNYGGGIYVYNSMPMIVNTILLNNQAEEQPNQICLDANSVSFSDMQVVDCGSIENACVQKYNHRRATWEPYYKFFGKPCGRKNSIQSDESLFISYIKD